MSIPPWFWIHERISDSQPNSSTKQVPNGLSELPFSRKIYHMSYIIFYTQMPLPPIYFIIRISNSCSNSLQPLIPQDMYPRVYPRYIQVTIYPWSILNVAFMSYILSYMQVTLPPSVSIMRIANSYSNSLQTILEQDIYPKVYSS